MRLVFCIILFLVTCGLALAQDTETPTDLPTATYTATETPTITPTATTTATATPDLMIYMTIAAPASTGTPVAPQFLAVRMEATVGDIGIVIVGVAIFVLMLAGYVMKER